jgi:hypothetical protein
MGMAADSHSVSRTLLGSNLQSGSTVNGSYYGGFPHHGGGSSGGERGGPADVPNRSTVNSVRDDAASYFKEDGSGRSRSYINASTRENSFRKVDDRSGDAERDSDGLSFSQEMLDSVESLIRVPENFAAGAHGEMKRPTRKEIAAMQAIARKVCVFKLSFFLSILFFLKKNGAWVLTLVG